MNKLNKGNTKLMKKWHKKELPQFRIKWIKSTDPQVEALILV